LAKFIHYAAVLAAIFRDAKVIVLLFRVFIGGTISFVDHLIEGYKINSNLPIEERLYDSRFIHTSWIILLVLIPIFTVIILFSCCCLCFLTASQGRLSNE
jgi:hypothetical protein